MTTCIALIYKDKTYVAADGAVSRGDMIISADDIKIISYPEYHIMTSGPTSIGQAIELSHRSISLETQDDLTRLQSTLISEIQSKNLTTSLKEGKMLVATRGALSYYDGYDAEWTHYKDYIAIGSGANAAYGYIDASLDKFDGSFDSLFERISPGDFLQDTIRFVSKNTFGTNTFITSRTL